MPGTLTSAPRLLPWARRQLRDVATGHLPEYATPEWAALREDDPRKHAAMVMAAEAWRTTRRGIL